MKGFVRILEAIVASIIILTSLTFFFVPHLVKSSWDSALLQTLAQDSLQSAYENGVLTRSIKDNDKISLDNSFAAMLPNNVEFSVIVTGIPNDVTYVACVDCSVLNLSELQTMLEPLDFNYSKRNISIRLDSVQLSTVDIPEQTNVLFFFDKTKITTYKNKIEEFIGRGGNVFLLSGLTQQDVDGEIGHIFNLSSPDGAGAGGFDNPLNTEKISHAVAKYYAAISNRNLQSVGSETFNFLYSAGAGADRKNVVVYGGSTFVRVNRDIINGMGRSVWFADYSRSDHSNAETKKLDRLLKASIMWGSGESFYMVKKDPAPVHTKASLFVFDGDTYTVELIIWRIFF